MGLPRARSLYIIIDRGHRASRHCSFAKVAQFTLPPRILCSGRFNMNTFHALVAVISIAY